jgi:hypothetical protein
MENQRKGLIRITRSTGLIVICVGAVAMAFVPIIGVNIAKGVSLIDQVYDLLELNPKSHGYTLLALLILLTGCHLCLAYLLVRSSSNNKAGQSDSKNTTKVHSRCGEQISYQHGFEDGNETIQPESWRSDARLPMPNIIRCLDENCTGILGPDRKCSDCGKSF